MSIHLWSLVLFWLSIAVLVYVYFGYPLLIRASASIVGRPVRRDSGLRPSVTVIITAFNEEKSIRAKIANIRELDYPAGLLDVIVASDGSTDSTDDVVRSCSADGVRLVRVEGRVGKTACQNVAVEHARGEIVVFTDATTRIDRGAIAAMVGNFADPAVGCVAGLLVYQASGANLTAAGGVTYWSYEVGLREAESRLGTLIGVSGCLYAVRRSAYRPMAPGLISDFAIAMRMREQGLRTVLESPAVCFEETLDRSGHELAMRVRVAIRSIAALVAERRFLNIFRDPVFAWQLWSHKLLRYASPYWMLILFVSSVALSDNPLYRLALLAQISVILGGVAGFALQFRTHKLGILGKPYYFMLTNVASAIATLRYALGERMVTWKPIR